MPDPKEEAKELATQTGALAQRILYHPGFLHYLGWPEDVLHGQVEVHVGDKKAMIDGPLAPLIESLWQQGCETVTSCQDSGGPNEGDVDHAYVAFASAALGADRFKQALDGAGIPNTYLPSTFRLPLLVGGATLCHLVFDLVMIQFAPDRIGDVTSAVAQGLP